MIPYVQYGGPASRLAGGGQGEAAPCGGAGAAPLAKFLRNCMSRLWEKHQKIDVRELFWNNSKTVNPIKFPHDFA